MMTNDKKVIYNKVNFYPGNLYLYEGNDDEKMLMIDKEEEFDNDKGIFDLDSRNFHIVPNKDYEEGSNLLKIINAIRGEIVSKIVSKIQKKELNDAEFEFKEGEGSRGGSGQLQFEKYVMVKKGENKYLLCFERLYRHKDRIHCVLGKFQLYKYIGKSVNDKGICYPFGFKDGLSYNVDGNIVKNTDYSASVFEIADMDDVDMDDEIEIIVDEFIEFIRQNETGIEC